MSKERKELSGQEKETIKNKVAKAKENGTLEQYLCELDGTNSKIFLGPQNFRMATNAREKINCAFEAMLEFPDSDDVLNGLSEERKGQVTAYKENPAKKKLPDIESLESLPKQNSTDDQQPKPQPNQNTPGLTEKQKTIVQEAVKEAKKTKGGFIELIVSYTNNYKITESKYAIEALVASGDLGEALSGGKIVMPEATKRAIAREIIKQDKIDTIMKAENTTGLEEIKKEIASIQRELKKRAENLNPITQQQTKKHQEQEWHAKQSELSDNEKIAIKAGVAESKVEEGGFEKYLKDLNKTDVGTADEIHRSAKIEYAIAVASKDLGKALDGPSPERKAQVEKEIQLQKKQPKTLKQKAQDIGKRIKESVNKGMQNIGLKKGKGKGKGSNQGSIQGI